MEVCETITRHLYKLWRDNVLLDTALLCSGRHVTSAHQVVISAFSPVLMQRVLNAPCIPGSLQQQLKVGVQC